MGLFATPAPAPRRRCSNVAQRDSKIVAAPHFANLLYRSALSAWALESRGQLQVLNTVYFLICRDAPFLVLIVDQKSTIYLERGVIKESQKDLTLWKDLVVNDV